MQQHRIYADLHNVDEEGQVVLDTPVTTRSLEDTGIELQDGIGLVIVDTDTDDEVYGVIKSIDGTWVAETIEDIEE